MKISNLDISNVKTLEDLSKFATILFGQIQSAINSGLTFSENFSAVSIDVTFNSANADTPVIHGLKRVPVGYIKLGSSAAMTLYNGSESNTTDTLFLRSSATGSAKVLIF